MIFLYFILFIIGFSFSLLYSLNFQRQNFFYLSHQKVSQTKAEFVFIIIVIKDHQTLKKSQTFPFIDSSTSILCSIKANNHIFPATFIPCFSTPPKPNMRHGPGPGRAKSTEANWVQKVASGSVHRHSPVMCYKTPFPIFFIVKF